VLYRILSLSGGGVRGIFQAVCLRELASIHRQSLAPCFDVVAGTSTGSIIAMAVAFDLDLELVVDLFKSKGPAIFSARAFSGVRKGPKYKPELLRSALESVFGASTLADSHRLVVIPATTLNRLVSGCLLTSSVKAMSLTSS